MTDRASPSPEPSPTRRPWRREVPSGTSPPVNDDHYILYTGGRRDAKGVVWRHEDVFYALAAASIPTPTPDPTPRGDGGQGQAGQVTLLPIAPLMHGATQWSVMGQSFVGNRTILVPKFDLTRYGNCGTEQANSIMITGDAMGSPCRGLDDPGAEYDSRRCTPYVVRRPVLGAGQGRGSSALPLMISIHRFLRVGQHGMVTWARQHGHEERSTSRCSDTWSSTRTNERVESGSGVIGKMPLGTSLGYSTTRSERPRCHLRDGVRYSCLGLRHRRGERLDHPARRGGLDQLGGEKIFPEESNRPSGPTPRCSTHRGGPRRTLGSAGGRHHPPRADKHRRWRTPIHCRNAIAGYKVPASSMWWRHRAVAQRQTDYRWASEIVAEVPRDRQWGSRTRRVSETVPVRGCRPCVDRRCPRARPGAASGEARPVPST